MSQNNMGLDKPAEIEKTKEQIEAEKVVEAQVKAQDAQQRAVTLKLDENGLVKIETLADELRVCDTLVRAGMVPESLNTPQKLFGARQLCRELDLPVMSAIRQVYVINGSPALWGDTPLAIVRRSGKLKHIREYLIDKDYNEICFKNKNLNAEIFAAICEIEREGGERREYAFTMQDAITADLAGKAIWKKYRKRMIGMKARGLALKNEFSDVLMGIAMAEYDFDSIPNSGIRDVVDRSETTGLNKFFNEQQPQGDDHANNTSAPN